MSGKKKQERLEKKRAAVAKKNEADAEKLEERQIEDWKTISEKKARKAAKRAYKKTYKDYHLYT